MPPNHLAVYLSNRCNLSCGYCYVSVNEGPANFLNFEQIRASMDYFFDQVPSSDKKITFLGGEPLLNFPLLQQAVRYARKRRPDAVLQTFTNGLLLTPDKLRFLEEHEVYVTVSLDGKAGTNDLNRTFHDDSRRSVFEETMKALKDLPKERLGVSLVFTAKTVGDLLSNIDFFHRLGFKRITFNPELYELWPEERLAVLRDVMSGFKRYYRLLVEKDMSPFVIQILFAILENGPAQANWWHDCHNVVLGPDAKFYACDKALSFPIGDVPGQQTGSTREGLDWAKRRELYAEATLQIESLGHGKKESFCPMGVYFYGKQAGIEPARLLDNFEKVSSIFAGALSELAAQLQDHPTFEELYVRPRLV